MSSCHCLLSHHADLACMTSQQCLLHLMPNLNCAADHQDDFTCISHHSGGMQPCKPPPRTTARSPLSGSPTERTSCMTALHDIFGCPDAALPCFCILCSHLVACLCLIWCDNISEHHDELCGGNYTSPAVYAATLVPHQGLYCTSCSYTYYLPC